MQGLYLGVIFLNAVTLICLGRMFYKGVNQLRSLFDDPEDLHIITSIGTMLLILTSCIVTVIIESIFYSIMFL